MKLSELPQQWEQNDQQRPERPHHYQVHVALEDAARLKALAALYPGQSEEDLLNDLLEAALKKVPQARGE
ncbi:MAG: hypothetical protein EA349_04135 [Halomonadaceae bacterium]|nr:MAG: hypothetical protein EA349_04135 [Halomonadaceae bacterium]